jgi:aminotransferase in exopolysaccharide biosynthesis
MKAYKEFVEYVRHIYNKPEGFISLHEPRFIGNGKKYVNEAIDSTFVSSVGKFVNDFELKIAQMTGAKYAVAIVNGTNALHLALVMAGVKSNEEVITQTLTFTATANAISYINAIPHFVDVDKETLGLSPTKLRIHLQEIAEIKNGQCYNKNSGNRIAACVPMHTFGLPINMIELKSVCDEFRIPIVEDAAESLGSFYNKQHTGTFGLLGVISFNGNKIVTSGGGGVIITNDEELAIKAKHLSTQAKKPHAWDFDHDAVGYNYRMPNLNAALLCAQLEQLNNFVDNKREIWQKYNTFFMENNFANLVPEIDDAISNYWLNTILLNSKNEQQNFLQYTNDNHIMTRPIWKLMSSLEHFKYCPIANIENAIWLEDRVVNIPSSVIV